MHTHTHDTAYARRHRRNGAAVIRGNVPDEEGYVVGRAGQVALTAGGGAVESIYRTTVVSVPRAMDDADVAKPASADGGGRPRHPGQTP